MKTTEFRNQNRSKQNQDENSDDNNTGRNVSFDDLRPETDNQDDNDYSGIKPNNIDNLFSK